MRILNELYRDLEEQDVYMFWGRYGLKEKNDAVLISSRGENAVFLNADHIKTSVQEKMAVGHEWAHIQTGATYSVGCHKDVIRIAECRAYRAQIKKLLPFDEMREAIQDGCCSVFEISEQFNVTEDFVRNAIDYYEEECGMSFNE